MSSRLITLPVAQPGPWHEVRELLTPFSSAFPTEVIDALCHSARIVEYPAQVTLCREGEIEQTFYVVLDGRVEVHKLLEGDLLLINELSRGSHFGDLALLLDLPRTATIITAEPTRMLEIDRATFDRAIETNAAAVVALSKMIIKQFLAQEEKQLLEIARLKRRDAAPAKIFLSYARTDVGFVTRLANGLLKQKLDVWLDLYKIAPAKSWPRQIGEALDDCESMLVVLSPASVASGNVEDEWNYHLDQKKPIVTVLYEPCKIPYRLSKFQYINFHATDFDVAAARLIATLNTQGVSRAPFAERA